MITRLDYYVGEVLKKLKEKGLDENTLVIFSSDNGPHEEGGADRRCERNSVEIVNFFFFITVFLFIIFDAAN